MKKVITYESKLQEDGSYRLVTPCPINSDVKVYSKDCQACKHYNAIFSSPNAIECNADDVDDVNKKAKTKMKKGGTL